MRENEMHEGPNCLPTIMPYKLSILTCINNGYHQHIAHNDNE